MQGDRDVVSDRAVGSDLVVVPTSAAPFLGRIRDVHKPVDVQAFGPERVNETVLGRPAGRETFRVMSLAGAYRS